MAEPFDPTTNPPKIQIMKDFCQSLVCVRGDKYFMISLRFRNAKKRHNHIIHQQIR